VGLACGGTIDVLVQPDVPAAIATAAADIEHGSAVLTELPADAPPPAFGTHEPGPGGPPTVPIVVAEDGRLNGTTGDPAVDAELIRAASDALARGTSLTVAAEGRQWFVEAFPLRPRLVVVGAVQVAIPLVRMAREVGFETVVVDGRAAFATAERFPEVDRLVVGWPDEIADQIGLGPADSVAVLSHDVKFDEPAIVEALRRGCRYVGAVGSRKTQADRRSRLLAAGISRSELGRLHGPIGLDLGGRTPPETALAILAEIVAARHGGTGTPMHEHAMSASGDDEADVDAEARQATDTGPGLGTEPADPRPERPAPEPRPTGAAR
jgi:xanthine dehydrogenase accessory factor